MDVVLGEDATEVGAGRGAMLSPENGRAVATDAKVCGGGDAARRGQTPSASSMVSSGTEASDGSDDGQLGDGEDRADGGVSVERWRLPRPSASAHNGS